MERNRMEPRTRLCSKHCGNSHTFPAHGQVKVETRRRPKRRHQTAQEELDVRLHEQPDGNHFSDGGYRRASLIAFPYHLLYEIDSHGIWIAILRQERQILSTRSRHPSQGRGFAQSVAEITIYSNQALR